MLLHIRIMSSTKGIDFHAFTVVEIDIIFDTIQNIKQITRRVLNEKFSGFTQRC